MRAAVLWLLPLAALGWIWLKPAPPQSPCWEQVQAQPTPFVRSVRVEGEEVVVVTEEGSQRIARNPQRIVSTLPGITEALLWLGARARIVAVSPWCDLPAGANTPARVRVLPLDVEAMLSQQPDLVIADRRLVQRDLELLRARVPAVLALETSRTLADLGDALRVLALVLDTEAARQAVEQWHEQFGAWQALKGERQASETAGRALIVGQWDPLYALGPGSLLDDLVRQLGFANVACDLDSGASGPFLEELVFSRAPDVIVSTAGPLPQELESRWARVPAIAAGRVVDAAGDLYVRGGPRALDALKALERALAEGATVHEAPSTDSTDSTEREPAGQR